MPKNIGKVIINFAVGLGDFLPVTVLISFMTQLCVQLGFAQLGIYILFVHSISGMIASLLAPVLLLRFKIKQLLIATSLGIA